MKKNNRKRQGLSLIELAVTMLITTITVIAIGVVMVDNHRGWLDSYAKVYGGAANDAAMVQVAFEKIVRKASRTKYLISRDDLTVYYYEDWLNSTDLDRYARFYRSTDNPAEFCVEHGILDEDGDTQSISVVRLCSNVSDAEFKPTNGGIEMKLLLNDGRETTTALTTAILHNE
ncbi:MAG: hypothetical protein ISS71_04570 [Phycisphaerae bacterium]|nr:hypothetical protein [Phycisphaerae bacterium]